MLDWEKRVLDLEANDIEERTKDVHMLRVTKEMQKYLAAAGRRLAATFVPGCSPTSTLGQPDLIGRSIAVHSA